MSDGMRRDEFVILGQRYPLPLLDHTDNQTKNSIVMKATILFAKKGYGSVSMRDIAEAIGIKPASLYNHFESKKDLWHTILYHAKDLYLLYFSHLDKLMAKSNSLAGLVEIILREPKAMTNPFTAYAFSLIGAEQFNDEKAAAIYNDIFIRYSVDLIRKHFKRIIAAGRIKTFDTNLVCTFFMHTVLGAIAVSVHEYMGHSVPYDAKSIMTDLQKFIVETLDVVPEGS